MTAITVTLTQQTIDAALACLAAVAADEREPQRYRDWYSSAHEELAAAYKNGSPCHEAPETFSDRKSQPSTDIKAECPGCFGSGSKANVPVHVECPDCDGTGVKNGHAHGKLKHAHAHADQPHAHMLRAICQRPECESYPTHDIHPGP